MGPTTTSVRVYSVKTKIGFVCHLQDIFERFDRDRSGKIDANELRKGLTEKFKEKDTKQFCSGSQGDYLCHSKKARAAEVGQWAGKINGYCGNEPSDAEVEQLLVDAEKYTLANHLFWGLWRIIPGTLTTLSMRGRGFSSTG